MVSGIDGIRSNLQLQRTRYSGLRPLPHAAEQTR